MDLMIAGMLKRRIDKFRLITAKLMRKEELSNEDKEFLKKENVI